MLSHYVNFHIFRSRGQLFSAKIPLDDYKRRNNGITYRGIFKSITELPHDFESYNHKLESVKKKIFDQEKSEDGVFRYNFLFNKKVIEQNGFEVAIMGTASNPNRNEVGAHVCALLNRYAECENYTIFCPSDLREIKVGDSRVYNFDTLRAPEF